MLPESSRSDLSRARGTMRPRDRFTRLFALAIQRCARMAGERGGDQGLCDARRDPRGPGGEVADVPGDRWRSIAGSVYAMVYFIWGIAAVVTWIFFTAVTPDLVKNLATTFLGLALPIVTAFMRGG